MSARPVILLIAGVLWLLTATTPAPAATATPPASPTPTASPTLALPVLMGTPVPLPTEPITPENVDRIQQLAMWGRGAAKHAAFSPDGQTLALGTTAGVWLHDAKTMALRRFMLTDEEVTAMGFLADGQLIAQVGGKTINRWDVTTGTLVGSWSLDTERNSIERTAFAPDGARVAASLESGTGQVGVWELPDGRLLSVLDSQPGPERVLGSLAFSPDGARLASATLPNPDQPQTYEMLNNAVEVWDLKTGALIHTLPLPYKEERELSNVVFSADGKLLAVASGKDIFLWQVETGELLHTLKGHTGSMLSLAFSPDGAQLASASYDKTVRLWDVAEGKPLYTLTGGEVVTSMKNLSFSPDGTTLVSVGVQSVVNLWDTATGTFLGEVEGYAEGISSLAVAADGTLYTAHPNHQVIRQWNIQTGQITRRFSGQTTWGTKLAVSANAQTLAASQYDPYPSVLVWNADTGQLIQTLKNYQQSVGNLALSPEGNLLASSENWAVYIHNTQTGRQLHSLRAGEGRNAVASLAFSPDGLELAANGYKKVYMFEVQTGKLLLTLDEEVFAFSPDGTMMATVDRKGQINLRKADTGKMVRPLGKGYSPTFSPDGRMVLASVPDGVYLWEVATGRLLRAVTGIPGIGKVMFLPDGKMLLSISPREGGIARFWGIPPQ